jgi:hypothetical protein
MHDNEKIAWIVRLRMREPLGTDEQLDLADSLERLWFPKRVGRRSQSEYSERWISFLNAWADALRRDLDLRVEQMKKRNERPRGGLRTAAKAAMAEEHGITVRTLENRMQRLPIPRKKTG